METIYFKGNACHTYGLMPRAGKEAPCFTLQNENQTLPFLLSSYPQLQTTNSSA